MSEDAEATNPTGHTRPYGTAPSPPRPEQTVESIQARRIDMLEAKVRRLEETVREMKGFVEEHDDRLDANDMQHESYQRTLSSTQSAVVRMEADVSRLVDRFTASHLTLEGMLRRVLSHLRVGEDK